jgi:flagellar hook protein FlgE
MLRSLFSGISGLRSHQTMMDVVGNNIANVNTAGFKTSQTVFEDTLSQLLKAAGAPQGGAGGTNPAQVGLGVRVGQVNTNFGQGAAQTTGRSTDLMIQGDGFFVVRNGNENLYTRAGAFSFDANGRLVTSSGSVVQGWAADGAGNVNTNGPTGDIRLPMGTVLAPTASTTATVGGNLPADTAVGQTLRTSLTTYDDHGTEIALSANYTRTAAGWDVTLTRGGVTSGPTPLTFSADGKTPTPASLTVDGVAVDMGRLTGYSGAATLAALGQNGAPMGSLSAFTISPDGTLVGVFSNGQKQSLGQVALANFNNPPGLEKVGGSMYRTTVNSGLAQMGTAGDGGRGALATGTLEMSNVDLAQEFTNLIVAQRGFQANSRVITSSDEIVQDLVNLKR